MAAEAERSVLKDSLDLIQREKAEVELARLVLPAIPLPDELCVLDCKGKWPRLRGLRCSYHETGRLG